MQPGPDISGEVALIYHPACLEHDTGMHPESADRLRAILATLAQQGVSEDDLLRPPEEAPEVLAEVHDPRYISAIERAAEAGGGYWDLDTYISPNSYRAAIVAASSATVAVDCAKSGSRAAFALVRPPGHHALYRSAMGFCLFNNVAVAAQHAVRKHGLRRVLIVDWDVHHGNGTQDYFYPRSDVLYFSTHQYPFYPGSGPVGDTGAGEGRGYTVNVPLPAGVGDEGHSRVFDEILVPLARRFRPELILVSAGYDAHIADPIGGMAISVAGFHELARRVRQLADDIPECGGRLAAVLEGGYNVEALAASVLATIAAFGAGSEPESPPIFRSPEDVNQPYRWRRPPDISRLLADVKAIHNLS